MRRSLLCFFLLAAGFAAAPLPASAMSRAVYLLLQSPDKSLTPEEAAKERREFFQKLTKADPEKRQAMIRKRLEQIKAAQGL